LWSSHPQAVYETLSICQKDIWQNDYFDPVRVTQIKKINESPAERARLALYLIMSDVLSAAANLPEEIRLYNTALPRSMPGIPPSPYEVLSNMASSERQMDTVLMERIRATGNDLASGLALVGGTAATLFRGAKTVAAVTTLTTKTIGILAKQALLVTAISMAAGGLADYELWRAQHRELSGQVGQLVARLENSRGTIHTGLYLTEFKKAVERLGYFYNINLYMRDTGDGTPRQTINKRCLPSVKSILGDKSPRSLADSLVNQKLCQDATFLWIAASQFLTERFPDHKAARIMAGDLMGRAKRAYLSQLEVQAYWDSLPVCREVAHPEMLFKRAFQCGDGQT
jgi:hypothetical protein